MLIPPAPTPSSADTLWQYRLRRSVRLYLALGEPGVDAIMAEARLRLVERYLVQHLLAGKPPTLLALAKAQRQMQMAQQALLRSQAQVAAILQEWSAEQAIQPVRYATQLAGGGRPEAE